MFTGIIEQTAKIKKIKPHQEGMILTIETQKIIPQLKLGESIAVNGCCLTVIDFNKKNISFDLSSETIQKTIFSEIQLGDIVNLERALRLSDRLGGHLVSGHVDSIGQLKKIIDHKNSVEMIFAYPKKMSHLLIEKGSITIDGISLTISLKPKNQFSVYLIPHTLKITHLNQLKINQKVNLEFDQIGKFVERLLLVSGLDR